MNQYFLRADGTNGFTLIELNIVLIIVGLIAGGVLVGRDLINNSKMRSQIRQFEELETQINTFKLKYGCLPGDCNNITKFLGTSFNGNTVANGDGNETVTASVYCYSTTFSAGECLQQDVSGEVSQLFLHLNAAGIGNYKTKGTISTCGATVGVDYPEVAYGNNTGIFVTCLNSLVFPTIAPSFLRSRNVTVIGARNVTGGRIGYATGLLGGWPAASGSVGFPGSYIQMIDKKIDDGFPSSGKFGIINGSASGCASNVSTYANSNTCSATAGKIIGQ